MDRVINPSTFKQLFRFEGFERSANSSGGFNESFDQLVNTKGEWVQIDGSRYLDYGVDVTTNTYRATCYWRNSLEAMLTKNTRLVYNNADYKIIKKKIVGEQRRFYEFIVIEAR